MCLLVFLACLTFEVLRFVYVYVEGRIQTHVLEGAKYV